ncbi:hypothetical protein ACQP2F_14310 [Actinoplanes sp. CA-030573]|uniref:hypothetical protein n=1 Tax=Actinoplanes sp. CA-030573 TaxID=3239898 RepID=UPI003D941D78
MINDAGDIEAQLAVERRINQHPDAATNGWQVYGASTDRYGRGRRVPTGSYWAAFWDPREPLIVAAALDELEKLILARRGEMAAERRWVEGSALDRILPPEG